MPAPDPARALALPVDELALEVLADLVAANEWNEYNYLNSASQDPRYRGADPALRALAEALTWLRARGFIARTPGQTADAAIFVTRAGHAALKAGLGRKGNGSPPRGPAPLDRTSMSPAVPPRRVRAGRLRGDEGNRGARPRTRRTR